jgi:hypothetical protein
MRSCQIYDVGGCLDRCRTKAIKPIGQRAAFIEVHAVI